MGGTSPDTGATAGSSPGAGADGGTAQATGATGGSGALPNGGAGAGGTAGSAGTGTVDPPEPEPLLNLYALARGKTGYVAVGAKWSFGFESATGVIFQSNDGKSWSKVASELPVTLKDVEYGNERFIALGSEGEAAWAYVSDDGVHWNTGTNPTTYQGLGFAFGNGLFVAQGNDTLYTSVDGVTWENTGQTLRWAGVEFASDHFVAAAPAGSLYGTGKTWEPVTITDVFVNSISVRGYGDHFRGYASNVCCFGEEPESNQYYRLSSSDGANWTTEKVASSASLSLPLLDDGTLCIDSNDRQLLTGPDCDHLVEASAIPGYARASLEHDGIYLVAGDGGIFSSSDGATWTQVLSDP